MGDWLPEPGEDPLYRQFKAQCSISSLVTLECDRDIDALLEAVWAGHRSPVLGDIPTASTADPTVVNVAHEFTSKIADTIIWTAANVTAIRPTNRDCDSAAIRVMT